MPTYSKSQLPKASFTALNYARNADANANGYVSKTEAAALTPGRTKDVIRRFAEFHDEALRALKRRSSLTPGQLYAYSKQLLDEMRVVMDTKGNKDHKLQPNELRAHDVHVSMHVELLRIRHRIERLVELRIVQHLVALGAVERNHPGVQLLDGRLP